VKYILEGSVHKAGDQLRIRAQLVDATTGDDLARVLANAADPPLLRPPNVLPQPQRLQIAPESCGSSRPHRATTAQGWTRCSRRTGSRGHWAGRLPEVESCGRRP
jgi:hypothetical protein